VTQVSALNEQVEFMSSADPSIIVPDVMFDLFATVNHRGTLQSGHYVNNIQVDSVWYHCNDAAISLVSENEVMNADGAYLLFYIRSKHTGKFEVLDF
jgi:ubiquitin C-terminal hydrolase